MPSTRACLQIASSRGISCTCAWVVSPALVLESVSTHAETGMFFGNSQASITSALQAGSAIPASTTGVNHGLIRPRGLRIGLRLLCGVGGRAHDLDAHACPILQRESGVHLLTSLWTHVGRNSSPPLLRSYLIYIMCLQKEF